MLTDILSFLDWIVFFSVLLITIASVIYGQHLKKRAKGQDSFIELLLMGRQLTLPLFICTLVATWYGGIFGVTAIAFNKGIYNFVTQGFFWYIAYIIFALFLVNKVRQYKSVTLPELVGEMFGPKAQKISAIFNFFNVIPIAYVISLGIFLTSIFGGNITVMTFLGVMIVVFYSMFGGMRAVVFSDIIQFFFMCLAVLLVLIFSVRSFGGLNFLQSNLPASYFSPLGDESVMTTLVWGLIALSTLVDPNFYHRVFAAKSSATAKKGILLSTLVWFCFDICTTAGAMYAKAAMPHLDSKNAYMIYSLDILPDGLRGLFLAGILATILSTLDSYLFISGTTLSYDLLPKKYQHKISIHYLGIFSVGVLSVILAHYFQGNIKAVWKTLGSYSAACLLLPVSIGYLFPKKISDSQFCFAVLLGVIATTYWRNAAHSGFWIEVDELYIGALATLSGLIISKLIQIYKN